jgi:hypothetical protein
LLRNTVQVIIGTKSMEGPYPKRGGSRLVSRTKPEAEEEKTA